MEELGLTQRSLASEARVDPGTVNGLLRPTNKRWPYPGTRAKIEAVLWPWEPPGALARIRAGGTVPSAPPPPASDPVEETIRDLPHLLETDVDLFLSVYRTRRNGHTAKRLEDLEAMLARLEDTVADDEVRATIASQIQEQIDALRRTGYEPIRSDTEP